MQVLTVEEVLRMDYQSAGKDGETLTGVKGTIIFVDHAKEGVGKTGDAWKFQSITLAGATGDKIKCTLAKRETMPVEWKGKSVYITSKSGKHGLTGVKLKENRYESKDGEEKSYPQLWITGTAIISLTDQKQTTFQNGAVNERVAIQKRPEPSKAVSTPLAKVNASNVNPEAEFIEAKKMILKAANMLEFITKLMASKWTKIKAESPAMLKGIDYDEWLRNSTTTLMITFTRDNPIAAKFPSNFYAIAPSPEAKALKAPEGDEEIEEAIDEDVERSVAEEAQKTPAPAAPADTEDDPEEEEETEAPGPVAKSEPIDDSDVPF